MKGQGLNSSHHMFEVHITEPIVYVKLQVRQKELQIKIEGILDYNTSRFIIPSMSLPT